MRLSSINCLPREIIKVPFHVIRKHIFKAIIDNHDAKTLFNIIVVLSKSLTAKDIRIIKRKMMIPFAGTYKGRLNAEGYKLPNGMLHGLYTVYRNGYPSEILTYDNGRRQGPVKKFMVDKLIVKSSYNNGVYHGLCIKFNFNRTVRKLCYYNNGKANGIIRVYDAYGKLIRRYSKTNGVRNGPHIVYAGHNLCITTNSYYINGEKHGLYEEWRSNGSLSRRMHYNHGVLHGLYLCMDHNGHICDRYIYMYGVKHGFAIEAKTRSGTMVIECGYYFYSERIGLFKPFI